MELWSTISIAPYILQERYQMSLMLPAKLRNPYYVSWGIESLPSRLFDASNNRRPVGQTLYCIRFIIIKEEEQI